MTSDSVIVTPHPTFFIVWDVIVKQQTVYIYRHEWSEFYCACYYCWTQTAATPFPSLAEVRTAVVLTTAVLARCWLQLCCGVRFIGECECQRLLPLSAFSFYAFSLYCNLFVMLVLYVHNVILQLWTFSLWFWMQIVILVFYVHNVFLILDFFFVILDV